MVLDSVRGITAEYVHVVRGERRVGAHDQYHGIQEDTRREYISYTRGRRLCHVWLDEHPFGNPSQASRPNLQAGDHPGMFRGFEHACKRNRLIREQGLEYHTVWGNRSNWEWCIWRYLRPAWPEMLVEAIRRNLDFDFEALTGKLRGKVINQAYQDPLQAIKGVMTDLRSFLESDLRTIRAFGIGKARAPIEIIDPDLEDLPRYPLDRAMRFAMAMAPALTADVRKDTQLTQLCIPLITGKGLDSLGETVEVEGELMLRSFILVVKRILDLENIKLVPKAVTHKAASAEILGERWFTKACRSDREASVLLNPDLSKPKQKRVYCYLGGGGLSEASTWLAQGVVVRAKSWDEAAAVVAAVAVLTAGTPGKSVVLSSDFIATDSKDFKVSSDEGLLSLEGEALEGEPLQKT